jgi:predicted amidophosphoribosyltransferase
MAFIELQYCPRCCKETEHMNNKCCVCLKKDKEGILLESWGKLTVEEKLDYLFTRIK